MSNTTKVTASVTLANVTAENIANEKSIRAAISGEATIALKAGEAGIRAYGFLASVVELTEMKAVTLTEELGANKSRLSKAGKCVRFVVAEIIAPEIATAETYQEAIDYLVGEYESLNDAYSKMFPSETKAMTEEQAVKNLFSAVDKYDLDLQKIIALMGEEIRTRKGE